MAGIKVPTHSTTTGNINMKTLILAVSLTLLPLTASASFITDAEKEANETTKEWFGEGFKSECWNSSVHFDAAACDIISTDGVIEFHYTCFKEGADMTCEMSVPAPDEFMTSDRY